MEDADKSKDTSKSGDSEWNSPPPGEQEGADYYFNSDGYVVLTAKYLLERGYCCGNGCKNCPYDYKAVPEPRRSKLLEERKKNETNNNAS
jgi:hypothetical protein